MFNKTTIETAASGLVGFTHSYHPFYARLTTALQSSSSGYYVNALPGVTFDVIQKTIYDTVKSVPLIVGEYYEILSVDGGASFTSVGASANTVGVVFAATGTSPTWGGGELRLVSCRTYLASIYNQELQRLVHEFTQSAKAKLGLKEILSNQSVVNGVCKRNEKVTKSGRFIGYLLNPMASPNVVSRITQIGFMSDSVQTIPIYLYETSRNAALKTTNISTADADTMTWKATTQLASYDWVISHDSLNGGSGQQWLIGYFEEDMKSASAYKQEFDDASRHEAFRVYGRYLGVTPVAIPADKLNGTNIPDNDNLEGYACDDIAGFYFKFNVSCDITNVLVDNIAVFARPLQHAIAIRILEDAIRSGSDGIHNAVKDANLGKWQEHANVLKGQLYGGYDSNGVYHRGMMQNLTMDFSDIDKVCLKKKDTVLTVKWAL
jgi:hypothetical protein